MVNETIIDLSIDLYRIVSVPVSWQMSTSVRPTLAARSAPTSMAPTSATVAAVTS